MRKTIAPRNLSGSLRSSSTGWLLLVSCGLLLPLVGCSDADRAQAAVPAPPDVTWHEAASERGTYTVRWRSAPDPIPNNEPFELDVRVSAGPREEAPVPGLEIHVHADMPAHRHGMLRAPKTTPSGDGRYRVRGMLFHMAGFWRMHVDIVRDRELERATFDLTIE